MLQIHLAPCPASAWRDRKEPSKDFGGNYFVRSPIQGGYGELLVMDVDTHALMVAVPVRRFERDYRFQPAPVEQPESHVILPFRQSAGR